MSWKGKNNTRHKLAVCTSLLRNNVCGINIQFPRCFNILCHNIRTPLSSTMDNKLWLFKAIAVTSKTTNKTWKLQVHVKNIF